MKLYKIQAAATGIWTSGEAIVGVYTNKDEAERICRDFNPPLDSKLWQREHYSYHIEEIESDTLNSWNDIYISKNKHLSEGND